MFIVYNYVKFEFVTLSSFLFKQFILSSYKPELAYALKLQVTVYMLYACLTTSLFRLERQ